MKYTYELDALGRFKYLKVAKDGDSPTIEIATKEEFRKIYCLFHGVKNNKIVEIGFTEEEKRAQAKHNAVHRIEELKKLLAETDWKVVVNAELYQAGLPVKYPNLHAERQAWRDEINKLENA